MGQLPLSRVTPSRPFSYTGVDYPEPLTLKALLFRHPVHFTVVFIVGSRVVGMQYELFSILEASCGSVSVFTPKRA